MTKVTKMKTTAVLLASVVVAVMMTACEYEGGLLGRIEAEPTCSTGSLEFIEVEGTVDVTPQQITLGNEGDQPANFTLQDDASWLDISPDSVTSDGPDDDLTVDVTPELAGLLPGVYTATIWVRCGEWLKTVAVELVVAPYDPVGDNIIYVSIDGSDSLGNGSFVNPYRTVTKGVSVVKITGGKDTVYILPSDTAYAVGEAFPIQLDVLAAPDTVAVTAAGPEYVEISGGGSSRVFEVSSGETCTLSGLTVSDGDTSTESLPKHGAGVYVSNGTITIADCVFENCSADANGGAARVDGGSVASFSGCVFRLNDAVADGGAVSDSPGSTFDDCVFEGNTAGGAGGGVAGAGGQFTRCVFSGNSAVASGGGCFFGGKATVLDCTFELNGTGLNGGAIYAAGGALTVSGSTIFSNSAVGNGGGVWLSGGGTITKSAVGSNTANSGGGIYVTSTNASIPMNTITGNYATVSGGGIVFDAAVGGISMFYYCDVRDNTAGVSGGGVFVTGASPIACGPNSIVSNSAPTGGGVHIANGDLGTAWPRFFLNNLVALNQGGGVFFDSGTLDVGSCTIVDNEGTGLDRTALAVGGLLVVNGIFWGNDVDIDLNVATTAVSYCYISDGFDSGDPTNIDVSANPDPLFVNPSGEDYHLQAGSPCIDAGDDSADLWPVDLDGNDRTVGTVDMGCYEYQ